MVGERDFGRRCPLNQAGLRRDDRLRRRPGQLDPWCRLFISHVEATPIAATRSGRLALHGFLDELLPRVRADENGIPTDIFPRLAESSEPRPVRISPVVSFGHRPSGVRVSEPARPRRDSTPVRTSTTSHGTTGSPAASLPTRFASRSPLPERCGSSSTRTSMGRHSSLREQIRAHARPRRAFGVAVIFASWSPNGCMRVSVVSGHGFRRGSSWAAPTHADLSQLIPAYSRISL